ncbi:MAG: sugar kinase [Candidatus Omnitrophica bacterium]|nr:sugar kinase [Candidatus Omnitrophota bacterium]
MKHEDPYSGKPLVVVGTVAIDSIRTPFGEREQVFGGSASYFSYAASFFHKVSLVGVVGEDFPPEYRRVLQERTIDLSNLKTVSGKTFAWKGFYEDDMNSAKTLETHLNVLASFDPEISLNHDPEFVFLANVDPVLQLKVLDQLAKPSLRFTACDTMNYWIASKREDLLKVLARVDGFVLNDAEARQLTGEPNLVRAAQIIRGYGPGCVIIKKGEHGVLVNAYNRFFALPAFPLETVFDPTGAGDSFAGGMMGYLSVTGDTSFENLKRAAAYGSVMASFAVEEFGLEKLRKISRADLDERLHLFKQVSHF